MDAEELLTKKRAAAIKLAKELKPFDMELGDELLPIYMETLTEDMKQVARDNRRLAKELDMIAKAVRFEDGQLFTIIIDGEVEVISKLMRRHSTRISKACGLLYETAYIDFGAHEEAKVEDILKGDEEDDDDDEGTDAE